MDASLLESVCLVLEEYRPGTELIPATEGAVLPHTGLLDYGAYFDLALPPDRETQLRSRVMEEAADYLIRRVIAPDPSAPVSEAIRVTTIAPPHYSPFEVARLTRWWDAEPQNAFGLTPVSEEEFGTARQLIGTSFELLEQSSPDLHAEILALVREIAVARPEGAQRTAFGAASSFALWGGFVIDYASNDSWPLMFRTIVHESGHNLLFAIAREGPLVENDPDERFPSPVRSDPRPMDGIYHAAFVSARESLALDRLLCWNETSGALEPEDADLVLKLLEVSVLNFRDCLETLRKDASLTRLGADILAECESWMDESFALNPA